MSSLIQITQDPKFKKLLGKKIPLRFSCISKTGWPVILSLWYLLRDGKIYCATQKNAKIVEYLRLNSRCGFEIASEKPPYLGIRGRGKVVLREDISLEILESLISRYLINQKSSLAKFLLSQKDNEVALEIIPSKIFSWDYSERMKDVE